MGRKVAENHRILEQDSQGVAEELIQQQNMSEDFVFGENEEKIQQKESTNNDIVEQKEVKQEFQGIVILTGAASYPDSGIRYFKNKPVEVSDQRVYEQLLKTGLFIHI